MSTTISIEDLAHGSADGALFADDATITRPVLIVDLDDAPTEFLDRATEAARASDRLLVGRTSKPDGLLALEPLLEALDLTYAPVPDRRSRAVVPSADPDGSVAEFVAAVAATPQTALVARQVLRAAEDMTIAAALDVESLGYSTLQGGPEFRRWLDGRGERPLPPPSAEPVLVHRRDDTLQITLNRPERRNAYGTQLRDAFVDALRIAVLDETIDHVIVDGAGPSFCAGGDLDEFGRTPDTVTAHLVRTRGGAGRLVAQLADRTEVVLHGHCVGAGIEIPAFAHRVIATPDTVFRLPEVAMGLIPGAGGTVSIPRRIGRWRALHLFVTAAPLDAERALAWGLIDEIRAR